MRAGQSSRVNSTGAVPLSPLTDFGQTRQLFAGHQGDVFIDGMLPHVVVSNRAIKLAWARVAGKARSEIAADSLVSAVAEAKRG
jgi:hypothetical protein